MRTTRSAAIITNNGDTDGELIGFDQKLANVRSTYKGPLVIAEDLMCIPVGD